AVRFERRKITEPILLEIKELPPGIKISGALPQRISAGQASSCLVLSVARDAPLGDRALRVTVSAAGMRADGVVRLLVVPSRPAPDQLAEENKTVAASPRDPVAYLNRALTFRRTRDYSKAFADYAEALRLDPAFARVYHSRGNVYSQLKQYEKALADF